jgi:hypothetical protein
VRANIPSQRAFRTAALDVDPNARPVAVSIDVVLPDEQVAVHDSA